jgi:hypothetical protein
MSACSEFTIIFGLRHPRFMKKRTAKTATITTTMASTIVVSVIRVLRYGLAQSSKAGLRSLRGKQYLTNRFSDVKTDAPIAVQL